MAGRKTKKRMKSCKRSERLYYQCKHLHSHCSHVDGMVRYIDFVSDAHRIMPFALDTVPSIIV